MIGNSGDLLKTYPHKSRRRRYQAINEDSVFHSGSYSLNYVFGVLVRLAHLLLTTENRAFSGLHAIILTS
jgi:hypothetical protein